MSDTPALWAALSHMSIDLAGGRGFHEALAEAQGWTVGFAARVTDEYRRFLYLAATADFEVTPSQAIDQAWHLHLSCPHYREVLCELILGRSLDHWPATGEPGEEERHHRQYKATVALYERAFLKPPPSDIWPRPLAAEQGGFERRRWAGRRIGLATAAAGLVAGLAAPAVGTPALTPTLLVGAALLGLICFPFEALLGSRPRRRGSAGCGAYCGGGGRSDGCASCGGSCGGGGCGGD